MRADRRNKVIDYAIQKLTALKKGATAPAKLVSTPSTKVLPTKTTVAKRRTSESLVAESVERFYITTNKHFRK